MLSGWIMRISWISIFLLHPVFARAEVIHEFKKSMVGFQNHTVAGETYFFSLNPWAETQEGTQAYWAIIFDGIHERKVKSQINYEVLNPLCTPKSQDTMSMSAAGGMTLAHPYLVGVGQVCYIDDQKHTIDLVSEIRSLLPPQHFSVAFAGSDKKEYLFVVNSFPPNKKSGILSLIRINRENHSIGVLAEWITEVPGLSGAIHPSEALAPKALAPEAFTSEALAASKGNDPVIWYTAALADRTTRGNIIFKLHAQELLRRKTSRLRSVPFTTEGLATQMSPAVKQPFSFFMISNEDHLLYTNDEYGAYLVDQKTMNSRNVVLPDGCLPIRGFKKQWLLLCEEKILRLSNLESLPENSPEN